MSFPSDCNGKNPYFSRDSGHCHPFVFIKSYPQDPETPFLDGQQAKKPLSIKLFYLRLVLALELALSLVLFPLLAQASILSFLGINNSVTPVQAIAHDSVPNSQNILLPQASIPITSTDPTKDSATPTSLAADGNALVADAGPLGTAADVSQDDSSYSDPSNISVYVVKNGDTLPVIAKMFGVSSNTIAWANDIDVKAKLAPGQTLVILPISGIAYTVKKGDTLPGIAKKLKADVSDIERYNGIELDSTLSAGDTLIIPDGELGTVGVASGSSSSSSKPSGNTGTNTSSGNSSAPYTLSKNNSKLPLVALGATRYLPGHDGPDLGDYFSRPVKGCTVTQGAHGANAVDIACPKDTPIMASADGVVLIAKGTGAWDGGFGNYVVVNHSNGTQTLYAHMDKVLVTPGETVTRGETIGLMGKTGEATGYHVHWEVHGAINPIAKNFSYGK